MAKFEARDEGLYIDGKRVLRGYESFTGWFWFQTEDAGKQDSIIDGRVVKDDPIAFGYVQGHEEEWGYWSQGELDALIRAGKAWPIKKRDLPFAGRRGER